MALRVANSWCRFAFSQAKSVAEFHEHVTMRVCGDDPDDSTYGDYLGAHSVRRIGSGDTSTCMTEFLLSGLNSAEAVHRAHCFLSRSQV